MVDKFRIERVIGRGGMGLVYLAQELDATGKASRPAVIKLLAPQWLDDRTAVERFEREGKRLQQLAHPNVVQMYECGRHADAAYIAMEYLDGEPLRRFLRRRGRLSLAEFVPIAAQVLAAVGYAHTFKIMLRDIKPPNIMLCERDGKANFVKLLDFGLAKLVDGDHEEVTKSHVIGTAGYLAPEQIKGEPCDVRVDVYAIGVLFYLLLAGESPIAGENDGALLYNHVHGTPKPLGSVLPVGHNVPEALIALVHQCLEKEPSRRLSDANEVAEALFECVPPKLLTLPAADDESRRALREYRDARDRGEDEDGARAQSSSEWTKPVVKAAADAPADLSAAGLPPPSPAPRSGPPRPPSRPNAAAGVGRPTPPGPVADRKPPPRRPTPTLAATRSAGIPELVRDRQGSRASGAKTTLPPPQPPRRVPRPKLPTGSSDSIPAVPAMVVSPRAAEPEFIVVEEVSGPHETAVAALHETGPVAADGGIYEREGRRFHLPVPRRVLALFAVGLVTIGALAAWIVFVPPDGAPVTTSAPPATASAAPTTTSPTPASSPAPTPSPADAAPAPIDAAPPPVDPNSGAVEVKAIDGARIEVDGVDMGPAPLRAPLSVGTHRVRVSAPGYVTWEETIDIVEGENPTLEPKLKRKRGKAALPSVEEPSGSEQPAPTQPTGPAVESKPKTASPFDDDDGGSGPEGRDATATPITPKVEPAKPPPPPPPPPAPDPKRDENPFLPVKKSKPTDSGLLPTG